MKEEQINTSECELEGCLLIRYIRGISSGEENERVALWLKANPDNEKILLLTARIYHAQRTKERIQNRRPVLAFEKLNQRRQKKAQRIVLKRILAAAACIAIVVSVAANYFLLKQDKQTSQPQYVSIQTNAGMRTNLDLPDGTTVFLNSASKLTYPASFDSNERRVTLEGECYFRVAHNQKQPFIVSVEDKSLDVEALGTEFNLQAYPVEQQVRTTLVKGSVKITTQNESGEQEKAILKPSERATYEMGKSVQIVRVNTIYDTAWMQGRLMFRDTPVPELLMRLSHFYNVKFEIKDEVINNYTFTGTFENRQLSQVLDYLSISSRIRYKIIETAEDDSQGVKRTKVVLMKRI
jgi:ferric-dicitrate binding protein FerR (iron transport regulator)